MKREELLKFEPTATNVLVEMVPIKKSVILLDKQETADLDTHIFTVIAVGPDVKTVYKGDRIIPTGGALVQIPVEDLANNHYIVYTPESMIKFRLGQ